MSAQFVVETTTHGQPIGVVTAYDEDLQNGHAKFAFQRTDSTPATGGEMIEAIATFISYLFDHFPYRKLYADLPEYNLYLVEGLVESILEVEGRLKDFYYYNDTYWDLVIVALTRQRWDDFIAGFGLEDVRPNRKS